MISGEDFYLYFVISLFCVELLAALLYFTSVWVRQGYSGKDKQLDLFETGVYYKHVIGFLFVFVVTGMVFIPPLIEYAFPGEAWIFMGGIFTAIMGTEIFIEKKFFTKKSSSTIDHDDTSK